MWYSLEWMFVGEEILECEMFDLLHSSKIFVRFYLCYHSNCYCLCMAIKAKCFHIMPWLSTLWNVCRCINIFETVNMPRWVFWCEWFLITCHMWQVCRTSICNFKFNVSRLSDFNCYFLSLFYACKLELRSSAAWLIQVWFTMNNLC